jgi:pyrroline-5-carboxylate reductase
MQIAILGGGTMGRAILGGLIDSGRASKDGVRVTTRSAASAEEFEREFGVSTGTDNLAAVQGAELILLCVKPKTIQALGAEIRGALEPGQCVVSIAAGARIEALAEVLPEGQPIVRAMPNTPCLVREGMTVLSRSGDVTDEQLKQVTGVFDSLGRVLTLDEEHMDAVTGLSASGPAFVYVILESLAEGGVLTGLSRRVATELAAQTVMGAARMVMETGRHPADLKDAVTTPAGCTINALLTLEDGKLRSTLVRAVKAAADSARGLGPPRS